jgi:hypothetical protein
MACLEDEEEEDGMVVLYSVIYGFELTIILVVMNLKRSALRYENLNSRHDDVAGVTYSTQVCGRY